MRRRSSARQAAASARARVGVTGNREYNPGWHTALDLRTCSRRGGHHALGARAQGEPRRPLPRGLSGQGAEFGTFNIVVRGPGRDHAGDARAAAPRCPRAEAGHRGAEAVSKPRRTRRHEEHETLTHGAATFRIWRGAASRRRVRRTTPPRSPRGHGRARRRAPDPGRAGADLACRWNCKAGKCGSCSAEINGKPRLMCMTRLNELDLDEPVTVEPMRRSRSSSDLS
jgi:hypothetical protein